MEDLVSPANQPQETPQQKFVLWVDGAGGALVCLGEKVTLGGLRNDPNRADVCFMSNLARKHLTLIRAHGSYQLEAHHPVTFKSHPLPIDRNERMTLEDKTEWKMGDGVEIRFRLPTVLSMTAVLDFQSSHRPLVGQPPIAVDQVVLMDQNCLIGPGNGQHIRLRGSEDGVILFQSKNQLWCKSKVPFSKNGETQNTSSSLLPGDIVTGRDFRFRLEALEIAAG